MYEPSLAEYVWGVSLAALAARARARHGTSRITSKVPVSHLSHRGSHQFQVSHQVQVLPRAFHLLQVFRLLRAFLPLRVLLPVMALY